MPSTGRLVAIQALLVVGGIGAYHAAFAPAPRRGGRDGPSLAPDAARSLEGSLAALQRDVNDLKSRPSAGGVAAGDASAVALQSRLESLEQRMISTSADAGGRRVGELPAGVDDKPSGYTEGQIASLRAMMDEVELRRMMDQETTSYRDLVRRVVPNAAPAAQASAVSLLTAFIRKVRGIFAGGSSGDSGEARAATNAKAGVERATLMQALASVLSKDEVEHLSPHIPVFGLETPHLPPNVTAVGVPARILLPKAARGSATWGAGGRSPPRGRSGP